MKQNAMRIKLQLHGEAKNIQSQEEVPVVPVSETSLSMQCSSQIATVFGLLSKARAFLSG